MLLLILDFFIQINYIEFVILYFSLLNLVILYRIYWIIFFVYVLFIFLSLSFIILFLVIIFKLYLLILKLYIYNSITNKNLMYIILVSNANKLK